MTIALNIAHAFVIGPTLMYIGLMPDTLNDTAYSTLLFAGFFILFYHIYKAYNKLKNNNSAWINWIHIFLVAPLLMIVGYMKQDASRRYFEMILMLGIAATGYHAIYLIREMLIM